MRRTRGRRLVDRVEDERAMDHRDHVRLIEAGVGPGSGGVWAEMGAGTGAFTVALRDAAGSEVEIIAVDQDRQALRVLSREMEARFPRTKLRLVPADFTGPLDLPPLDGLLAANALHFARDQAAVLRRWRGYLRPGGRLVVVEYDADEGNRWVPYPVSFAALGRLARAAGFAEPVRLGSRPSRFLGSIYAAVARA